MTGGFDTHLDVHVAAVVDQVGGVLGVESFPILRPATSAAASSTHERSVIWTYRAPLTAAQQAVVSAESAGPPVLCPDGDPAGRRAAVRWVMEMTVAGREVLAATLPGVLVPITANVAATALV